MPRNEQAFIAFNRGLISRLAVARVDLKRAAFSAREMVNWMPRSMGSMMLRAGWQYLLTVNDSLPTRNIPFVFANDDTAILEFTNAVMRVIIDDAVMTRPTVASAVTNGNFDSNLTGWTDNDESGAASVWVTGGYMGLTGTGTTAAIRDQQVTVAAGDIGIEHALRVVIQRGPVIFRVGSSSGGEQYVTETTLGTGTHSLAFTPTGNFHIRFMSRLERQVLVDSCNVEAAGAVEITSPYLTADLDLIRAGPDSQSGDIIFVACNGYQQRKIERRATKSWSLVLYQPEDGPFRLENVGPITITSSALVGNVTLTASDPLFRSAQVGALFSITSQGQAVTQTATGDNTFTGVIQVSGVDNGRVFTITVTGLTATGSNVTLQRSLDSDAGPWIDIENYTTNQSKSFDDTLDNQIAFYRIGVKTGNYSTGTIVMTLNYTVGSITGIVRLTAFSSSTSVSAEVLRDLGGTTATDVWAEGKWSDLRGWPSAVSFHEGRLAWAGKGTVDLSASDQFDVFDPDTEGDSGPISKDIGSGPVSVINWILPLQRMLMGGDSAEFVTKSSAFDEPLTPTNCNIKADTTQGSAGVSGVKIDSRGLMVQRGGSRVFELSLGNDITTYQAIDLTLLIPEIGKPRIVRTGVQRQPDTRLHCVRSDGTVAVLVYDQAESVLCWIEIESPGAGGLVEDVVVLPDEAGTDEDQVYYVVKRTINGSTVRYLEKWALESECAGSTLNKQADSFIVFNNGVASTAVTGLGHLEGEDVVVWQDGVCPEDADGEPQTYTVTAGAITLDTAATTGIVGLAYTAPWKSAKLGQALTHIKKIDHLGLILIDVHPKGLKFGRDFTNMDDLPQTYESGPWDQDEVKEEYDQPPVEFPGEWSSDARLCLQAQAPRNVTVAAAIAIGEVYA